jgi:hypothetical protein
MRRKPSRRAALVLTIVAGLLVGLWLARIAVSAWLGFNPPGSTAPVAELSHTTRDLGTVSQGPVLRTTFPITNAGARRLVLIEHSEGSCDESAEPRQVILTPGDSAELEVEVNTALWYGQMEHVVHYTTNDPRLPRFDLTVTATVQSPPGP